MDIKSVSVIGAGQMGSGIAQVIAGAEFEVRLYDISRDALDKSLANITKNLNRAIGRSILTEDDKDRTLKNITTVTSLADCGSVDLVIEAATERESIKQAIFEDILPHIGSNTILTSNTSSISITRLASRTDRPEKFMGLHFMNPVPIMQLVELIRGIATDEKTYKSVDALVEKIGKNISGSGMDPNITGRNCRDVEWEMSPNVKKIAVLGLTPETHGNATGLGAADVITMDVYRELDIAKTYANVITSMYLDGAAIPIIMNNDREAIQLAVKTVVRVKPENTKVVRISTTLEVMDLHVSENLLPYIKNNPDKFEILGEPAVTKFDDNGKIYPMMAVSAHAKV